MSGQLGRLGLALVVLAAILALPWASKEVFQYMEGHEFGRSASAVAPASMAESDAQLLAGPSALAPVDDSAGDASSAHEVPSYFGLPTHYAPDGDMVMALFARLTSVPEQANLPEGFASEVLDPAGLPNVKSYTAPGVVGLCWESVGENAADALARELESNAWVRTGATEAGATYLKEEGAYRWLSVQVGQSAGYVSALFAYERVGEG